MRSVVEIGASVPAFLAKLWKLVNDAETNSLITWTPGGKTFCIKNQADFARELLPLYYKHNNMASFIRQLNMYGFHKITSVENGGLRYEKDEIEFSHPCFMRGHSYLLEHIKRKIANPKTVITSDENGDKILYKPELMNKVLNDVKSMKGKQENMDAKFSVMKQENEALWREVAMLRQKHIKQQQIVNNLIQFLMSLVNSGRSSNLNTNGVGGKRGFQLMINNAAHNLKDNASPTSAKMPRMEIPVAEENIDESMEEGPTIHELAHDDILHTETGENLSPNDYLTIEVPPVSPSFPTVSPGGTVNNKNSRYQVTMVDGDEAEHVDPSVLINGTMISPIVTSPSPVLTSTSPIPPTATIITQQQQQQVQPKPLVVNIAPTTSKVKVVSKTPIFKDATTSSMSHFNSIPLANLKLPANIFANDESNTEMATQIPCAEQQKNAAVAYTPSVLCKDEMLSIDDDLFKNITQGSYSKTPKNDASSKKSSKKQKQTPNVSIKVERDDTDWNAMSLATLQDNYDANKINSIDDLDDHLDTMQSDIDSLRELLRSDSYTFDANTLMGLFGQDDPLYGLSYTPYEERDGKGKKRQLTKCKILESEADTSNDLLFNSADDENAESNSNQLISYTGNMCDFSDLGLVEEITQDSPSSLQSDLLSDSTTLNTPQVTLKSPFTSNGK